MSRRHAAAVLAVAATGLAAGCGSGSGKSSSAANPNAPEVSPSGDIPDNQAYVPFRLPAGHVTIKVPEGWARSASGGAVTFTDKLNSIRLETARASRPLTAATATHVEIPKLARSARGFASPKVGAVHRRAGTALRITYLASSKPDAVTGKVTTDAVERYVFFRSGRRAILTLSGPKAADNVDPWKLVSDSLRFTP